jgi:hypothetical protein
MRQYLNALESNYQLFELCLLPRDDLCYGFTQGLDEIQFFWVLVVEWCYLCACRCISVVISTKPTAGITGGESKHLTAKLRPYYEYTTASKANANRPPWPQLISKMASLLVPAAYLAVLVVALLIFGRIYRKRVACMPSTIQFLSICSYHFSVAKTGTMVPCTPRAGHLRVTPPVRPACQ